jgi:hypothetical protein
MILIYSRDTDSFVNDVVDYLEKDSFVRVGDREKVQIDKININKAEFIISNIFDKEINLFDISSIWFNGGVPQVEGNIYEKDLYKCLFESFLDKNDCFKLGKTYLDFEFNKFDSVLIAKKCGLKVPDTIITNNRLEVKNFFKRHNKKGVICKRITDKIFYEGENFISNIGNTFLVDNEFIKKIPANFAISLFQERIIPDFEIRIFYFLDEFYSMAIFNDDKNIIDIRTSFLDINTRMVPFELPKTVKLKIKKILKIYKTNYCSIDMICHKNTYYFLEINPIGQVQFLNRSCNYYLEKKLSKILKNEKQKK